MGIILFKIADFLVAICVASIIALLLGYVAHYLFGLSRLDVRTAALIGAGIFALRAAGGDRVVAAKIQMTPVSWWLLCLAPS